MRNRKVGNISRILLGVLFLILTLTFLPKVANASDEKKITVVFRYDDYSNESPTDLELKLIDSFKQFNVPVTFGVIPYRCPEDSEDRCPQNAIPLTSEKAKILKEAIKAGTLEVALHGYTHQTISGRVDGNYTEFFGLDYNSQMQKITRGKNLLEGLLGVRITTFIPPWNSYDLNTIKALEEIGFRSISAGRIGVAREFSQLRFLPAICLLDHMEEAIKLARKISNNNTIVVVLFHPYDFVEVNREKGKLSYHGFVELLTWITSQKDVQFSTIDRTTQMIGDLDSDRFMNYSSLFSSPLNRVLPVFLMERYSGYWRIYPSSVIIKALKVKRLLFLVIFYITLFTISIAITFVGGGFLFSRIRPLELGVKYGVLVPLFFWVYAFHNSGVYFRGAMVLDVVTGMYIGIFARLYKLRSNSNESDKRRQQMDHVSTTAARPFLHIRPKKGLQLIDFKELKKYRDLFYFLVVRDIKVRYKQTVLGGLWAIIQPFFSMIVFTLFFGKLAKLPSDGVPYPIFNFTAMVAWTYFSNAVTGSGNSLIGNTQLLSKVYFPRIIIPLTPVLAGLLDFSIAFMMLIGMMFYFNIYPTPMVLLLPVLLFLMMLTASGVGTFLAALNAKYRDIKHTTPLLLHLWMFVSPVVYPTSMVPEKYRFIYSLNPLSGVIEGFRSILLGTVPFPTQMVLFSGFSSLILFIIGISYFKQMERSFADII